jgi:hypothetical protein
MRASGLPSAAAIWATDGSSVAQRPASLVWVARESTISEILAQ